MSNQELLKIRCSSPLLFHLCLLCQLSFQVLDKVKLINIYVYFFKLYQSRILNGASITMTDELFPSAGFKVQSFWFSVSDSFILLIRLGQKMLFIFANVFHFVDHPIVGPKSYTIAHFFFSRNQLMYEHYCQANLMYFLNC